MSSLNAMAIIRSQDIRDQVTTPNHSTQGRYGYHNGQWSQSINKNSLTPIGLWYWLVDHVSPRKEIDGLSTEWKSSR